MEISITLLGAGLFAGADRYFLDTTQLPDDLRIVVEGLITQSLFYDLPYAYELITSTLDTYSMHVQIWDGVRLHTVKTNHSSLVCNVPLGSVIKGMLLGTYTE